MSSANLTSIEALRRFKAALLQFEADVTDAITMLELEAQRPVDWIETDRTLYWPREVKKASDVVNEARLALERCLLTIDGDSGKTCYDEKKALQKAKRRLETSELKVKAVGRWKVRIHKEVNDFKTQLAKVKHYLESDFIQAVVALERMAQSLDKYVESPGPAAAKTSIARDSTNAGEAP